MKKLGFTLAEVLISLALVGVVSALTVPTLVSSHQRNVQGATLATAVSDFETAMRSMMAAEDVTELYDTKAWRGLTTLLRPVSSEDDIKEFMGNISDYLELSGYERRAATFYNGRTLKQLNRAALGFNSYSMNSQVVFSSPKGVAYFIHVSNLRNDAQRVAAQQALTNGITLTETAGFVTIDINGLSLIHI